MTTARGIYQDNFTRIQGLVHDMATTGNGEGFMLSSSIKSYLSSLLDEILDSNSDLFGETNHMTYFRENSITFEIEFHNIGKVEKCSFGFSKYTENLVNEVINTLWALYSFRCSYELDKIPDRKDARCFAKAMSEFFIVDKTSFLKDKSS